MGRARRGPDPPSPRCVEVTRSGTCAPWPCTNKKTVEKPKTATVSDSGKLPVRSRFAATEKYRPNTVPAPARACPPKAGRNRPARGVWWPLWASTCAGLASVSSGRVVASYGLLTASAGAFGPSYLVRFTGVGASAGARCRSSPSPGTPRRPVGRRPSGWRPTHPARHVRRG